VYSDIIATLVEKAQAMGVFHNVLDYEPKAVAIAPMGYFFLAGWNRNQRGGVITMNYDITFRAVLPWADNEQTEHDLMPLVNQIPTAFEEDMTLGGDRRISQVSLGVAEYRNISGTTYRTMDTTISVRENAAVGDGV
jgi:hypothetical protein